MNQPSTSSTRGMSKGMFLIPCVLTYVVGSASPLRRPHRLPAGLRVVASLVVAALGLGACGTGKMDCGSDDVLAVVTEVLRNDENVAEVYGTDIGLENTFDMEVEFGHYCDADLVARGGLLTSNVSYTVEMIWRPDAEEFEKRRAELAKDLAAQTERKRRRRWEGVYGSDGVLSVGDGFVVVVRLPKLR